MSVPHEEVLAAYRDYDRDVTIANVRVGCVLGMILMPAGAVLDFFVYEYFWEKFLGLRLFSSLLIGAFLAVLLTRFGRTYHRQLGIILLLIPTSFIAFMIYATGGAASPYYAGINLVLLMVAFVLRWTFWESLIAVVLALSIYMAACLFPGPGTPYDFELAPDEVSVERVAKKRGQPPDRASVKHMVVKEGGLFANNLYFLALTGIIVVTGNYFLSAWRFREFSLRYELDRNRHELEESNRRLTELDQLKSRFFANISHELRTPLTLLLAPLESMIHRHGAALGSEAQDLLRTMHSNGLRLLKLINDLLDLVRLDAGVATVRRESVDLPELLKGLASSVSAMATEKGIRLESVIHPGLGRGWVDRDKLEKIILNLVFNALKFTPAGGRVQLAGSRAGPDFLFKVIDTGIGISEKQLPHVFDRFWQADASARRRHQGAGIGLALTKELTEAQGGSVSVESQPGRGTTFTVRLPGVPEGIPERGLPQGEADTEGPGEMSTVVDDTHHWLAGLYRRADLSPVSAAALPPVSLDPEGQHAADAPCILVADDEPDMRRFLASQLRNKYRVLEAVDGRQALELAVEWKPELILLDMMMPEKDGLQVCRELREQPPTQSLPIILLTARVDEETKLAALSSGANDFLVKPFSTTELKVRVTNLIGSHQLQRRLGEQNQLLTGTLKQLKEMQSQLVQAEKLTSLGRLSAGIIHEINNPLNFAATGLYALRQRQHHVADPQRREFEEILHDIEEGLGRVRDIVSDLRTFTFPNAAPTDEVRLSDAVGMALRFLSHEWSHRLEVRSAVPDSLVIRANRNKIVQVMVNLLQNAVDALSRKTFTDEAPLIQISGAAVAEGVRLQVRDNGPGIDGATVDKIFDPFFTTKEVGKGMGLGLSICYRIVQEAGGQISVRTEPGQFTEFNLLFPKPDRMN